MTSTMMATATAQRRATTATAIAPNFPAIGWAGRLSSWMLAFLGHHSGHFKMIHGRRLARYISINSFLPTLKPFVSSIPAGRFLEVLFAGIY
jgi:hypothetical protein